MNAADDVHAFDDTAKGCKTLPIGVAFAAVIEFRLIAKANEEVFLGSVGAVTSHADGTVQVPQTCVARPLERDGPIELVRLRGIRAPLDDLDLYPVSGLV